MVFTLTLSPNAEGAIEQQPTENIEAYEYYLRGRRHFYQFSEQGWEQAREAFSRAIELGPDDAVNLYNIACVYSNIGEIDEALVCLEDSVQKGMAQMDWIRHDSDLDNLREHPRFKALIPPN